MDHKNQNGQPKDPAISVDSLLSQCHELLSELEAFRDFLDQAKKKPALLPSGSYGNGLVDIRQFHSSILAESKSLQKVGEEDCVFDIFLPTLC